MAYKRKRSMKQKPRRGYRKRRSYRRKQSNIVDISRGIIRYGREVDMITLSILSGNNAVYYGFYFTLASFVPNYTEFTNLFDQYRMKYAIVKFRLICPPEATNTVATQQYYPDIACTVDHDDAGNPTSMNQILEYGRCKTGILMPNKWFTYKCHPTCASTIYRGATSAYAANPSKMWVDLAYTDVPFYGIKVGVDATKVSLQTQSLVVEMRAYTQWEFKNSR